MKAGPTPREGRKNENGCGKRKKARNFGPSTLRGPPFGPHPGPPPLRAPTPPGPLPAPTKNKIGQMRSGQIRSTKIGQIRPNKDGQMRPVDFGQIVVLAKFSLAKCGHGQMGWVDKTVPHWMGHTRLLVRKGLSYSKRSSTQEEASCLGVPCFSSDFCPKNPTLRYTSVFKAEVGTEEPYRLRWNWPNSVSTPFTLQQLFPPWYSLKTPSYRLVPLPSLHNFEYP